MATFDPVLARLIADEMRSSVQPKGAVEFDPRQSAILDQDFAMFVTMLRDRFMPNGDNDFFEPNCEGKTTCIDLFENETTYGQYAHPQVVAWVNAVPQNNYLRMCTAARFVGRGEEPANTCPETDEEAEAYSKDRAVCALLALSLHEIPITNDYS